MVTRNMLYNGLLTIPELPLPFYFTVWYVSNKLL